MENTFKSTKETRAKEAFTEVKIERFKAARTKAAIATSVGVGISLLGMKSNPYYSKGSVLIAAGFGIVQIATSKQGYTPDDFEEQDAANLGGKLLGALIGNRIVGALANKFVTPLGS